MITILSYLTTNIIVVHQDRLFMRQPLSYYPIHTTYERYLHGRVLKTRDNWIYVQDKCSTFNNQKLTTLNFGLWDVVWWPNKKEHLEKYLTELESPDLREPEPEVKNQVVTLLLLELSLLK